MKPILSIVSFLFLIAINTTAQSEISWISVYDADNGASFRGISAVSDQICWVSGSQGTILRTVDGGKTWQVKSIPGIDSLDFRDIEAFGPDTAVVMSIGEGHSSRVYRTEDGGRSWKLTHQNRHDNGFFDAIAFWNSDNGLLQGDPVDGRMYILRTTDGGKMWQEIPFDNRPTMADGEYAFAASGTQLITRPDGHAWIGTGGSRARLFYSSDYGKTWKVEQTSFLQGEPSRGIFSLAFSPDGSGVAVGGDYRQPLLVERNLLRTSNGGKTWQLSPEANMGYRSVVRYIPSTKAFIAAGPTGSNISLNSGITWQNIPGPGFHTLDTGGPHATVIWGAGADGRIARLHLKTDK